MFLLRFSLFFSFLYIDVQTEIKEQRRSKWPFVYGFLLHISVCVFSSKFHFEDALWALCRELLLVQLWCMGYQQLVNNPGREQKEWSLHKKKKTYIYTLRSAFSFLIVWMLLKGIFLFFWTLHVASMLKIAFRSAILYFFFFFACINTTMTPLQSFSLFHTVLTAHYSFLPPPPRHLFSWRWRGLREKPQISCSLLWASGVFCALRSLFFFHLRSPMDGFFLYCYICIYAFRGSNCVAIVLIFVQHARIRCCCFIFLFFLIAWVYLHAMRLRLRVFFSSSLREQLVVAFFSALFNTENKSCCLHWSTYRLVLYWFLIHTYTYTHFPFSWFFSAFFFRCCVCVRLFLLLCFLSAGFLFWLVSFSPSPKQQKKKRKLFAQRFDIVFRSSTI